MVVNGHVRAELQRALRVAITEQPCSATRCERVQAVLEELAATHGADWLESFRDFMKATFFSFCNALHL